MKVAKKHLKNCGVDQIGLTTKKNYLCKALRSAVLTKKREERATVRPAQS